MYCFLYKYVYCGCLQISSLTQRILIQFLFEDRQKRAYNTMRYKVFL
jgi:hypothetical protein